jgi:hypothetical protein
MLFNSLMLVPTPIPRCSVFLRTVSHEFLECRIIQPAWVDTFGRRDARAVPPSALVSLGVVKNF